MLQFYFLSVLLSLVTGLVLLCGPGRDSGDFLDDQGWGDSASESQRGFSNPILGFLEGRNFKLVLGVLGVLVGLMKLLPVVNSGVPVIGDLLPAATGIVGGLCVLVEFYMEANSIDYAPNGLIQRLLVDNRRIVGICCLAVATLHFVFPRAPLL